MAKKRRQYTPEEIAAGLAALQANGGNIKRTARELSMPEATLRKWHNTIKIEQPPPVSAQPECATECAVGKKELTGILAGQAIGNLPVLLESVAWKLSRMLPKAAKIARDKGQVSQIATAAAIAVDKALLIKGQPNSITRHDFSKMSREDLYRELDIIRARRVEFAQRRGGVCLSLAGSPDPPGTGESGDQSAVA